ncbi:unnamed protein product (macronuclear) [Paramecium tetraurelia]|uniref:Uncharacterized protein n=1 Tax=Paramecium tetraurelia TaxID=5888 RepID=A0BZ61_PARTE|nr:uncharacterized protein GSPATT00033681001 [Paramecium tetraurelia]CAK63828.1 unnamed protein product [Paramecium tetraurelia]|eukprot:XP_001431226.1 hypothetical protein (macronuclear) [Paramecium tetraurelia strain d4-2]
MRQAICVVPDTEITLNDKVYFFEQNKVQSIPVRSLLNQYLLQESEYVEEATQKEQDSDETLQQQEEYSDDENNGDDQGPSGGRMMPVIELIKGFIPRIVGAI